MYLLIALIVPTEFGISAPNETMSVNDVLVIEGYEQTSNLHSVSVLSMQRITPFQRMIYQLDNQFNLYPIGVYESQLTLFESHQRGQIQKEASYQQSVITAFLLAKEIKPSIEIDYTYLGMIIDYRESKHSDLKIGDIIVDINNLEFNDYYIMGSYFINNNGLLNLKINRDGNLLDIAINKDEYDVFRFYPKYINILTNPVVTINNQGFLTSGPSAGMMYTLSLYFSITDYTNINEIIAGTGTIKYNGQIGEIGGLRQKMYAAKKEGIKYFLIPQSQYHEVSDLTDSINIYPVSNINEAINKIYEIFS